MFKSFFFAGFECATGYNKHREWIDQTKATQHDIFVDDDYRMIAEHGLRAAREGIRWPLVDHCGKYDFSTVRPFIEAARNNEIEVIWDLFHYGFPDDIDLFSKEFPKRFADYCYACARYISAHTDGICYFTPINEPSYFAWAAGDACLFTPFCKGRSFELKLALTAAAIQGIEAIWDACPDARIVNVDPICHVTAPPHRKDLKKQVDHFNNNVIFESFDMISGRIYPELGGSPRHLDIVGMNYYWTNQWDITKVGTPLAVDDPRILPMRDLIKSVWDRYKTDILITETSHYGDLRPTWLRDLTMEVQAVCQENIPLRGICLYPILGMPEWHAQDEWALMGVWDCVKNGDNLERIPHEMTISTLKDVLIRDEWGVTIETPMVEQIESIQNRDAIAAN